MVAELWLDAADVVEELLAEAAAVVVEVTEEEPAEEDCAAVVDWVLVTVAVTDPVPPWLPT